MKLTDLKKGVGQYLAASAGGGGEARQFAPFAAEWKRDAAAYPLSAFREWAPRRQGVRPDFTRRHADALEKAIAAAQPAMLLTAAKQLDAFLNNQSLVVLFMFNGRKLLFAGDAQAGNWESWLFDTATPSKTGQGLPLSAQGAAILRNLQFYKVGHHGSTNATPIAAVEAMGEGITALCSTQSDTFGSVANQSEVPRGPLLDALARKNCALVRSDQIAAKVGEIDVPPAPDAPGNLPQPSSGRRTLGLLRGLLPVSVTRRGMTMAPNNARGKPAPGSGSPVRTIAPIAADGADLFPALPEALPLEPPTPLPSTAEPPAFRALKAYAFDPSLGRAPGNVITIPVRYEKLRPGPVGERIAVVDYDATRKCFYDPVDLDDPLLVLRGGAEPSESDPHFHQQMVYAVVSETLRRVESALGRVVRLRTATGAKPLRLHVLIYMRANRQMHGRSLLASSFSAIFAPGARQ